MSRARGHAELGSSAAVALCITLLLDLVADSSSQTEDGAEALQETWVQVLDRPETVPKLLDKEPLLAWLRTVRDRKRITVLRDRQRHAAVALDDVLGTMQEPCSLAEDPAVLLKQQEKCAQVWAALAEEKNALNVQMLTLRFQEGLTLREIAAVMGVPPERVHDRLRRIIAKLRKKLNVDDSSDRGG
jgi:RNA polymerase sigma factor (sigma-70 family)